MTSLSAPKEKLEFVLPDRTFKYEGYERNRERDLMDLIKLKNIPLEKVPNIIRANRIPGYETLSDDAIHQRYQQYLETKMKGRGSATVGTVPTTQSTTLGGVGTVKAPTQSIVLGSSAGSSGHLPRGNSVDFSQERQTSEWLNSSASGFGDVGPPANGRGTVTSSLASTPGAASSFGGLATSMDIGGASVPNSLSENADQAHHRQVEQLQQVITQLKVQVDEVPLLKKKISDLQHENHDLRAQLDHADARSKAQVLTLQLVIEDLRRHIQRLEEEKEHPPAAPPSATKPSPDGKRNPEHDHGRTSLNISLPDPKRASNNASAPTVTDRRSIDEDFANVDGEEGAGSGSRLETPGNDDDGTTTNSQQPTPVAVGDTSLTSGGSSPIKANLPHLGGEHSPDMGVSCADSLSSGKPNAKRKHKQNSVAVESLLNPNQFGVLIPSAFSPPFDAVDSEDLVNEQEERRAADTAKWYEVSALQLALSHYGVILQTAMACMGSNSSFDGASSFGKGGGPSSASPASSTKPSIASPFRKKLTLRKGGKASPATANGGTDPNGANSGESHHVFLRCSNNEPMLHGVDDPIPPFPSENLSPALQRHFGTRGSKNLSSMSVASPMLHSPANHHFDSENFDAAAAHRRSLSGQAESFFLAAPPAHGRTSTGNIPVMSPASQGPPGGGFGAGAGGSVNLASTLNSTATFGGSGGGGGSRPLPGSKLYRPDQLEIEFHFPNIFAQLSKVFCLKIQELILSAMECSWRLTESPGKSDSRMFFFGHFTLKTLTEAEAEFTKEAFLHRYLEYINDGHRDTLLPKFFAMLTVTGRRSGERQVWMLYNNVLRTKFFINKIFDLKGSTIGRDGASSEGHVAHRSSAGAPLLKDNDLPEEKLMFLGPQQKAVLLAQIRSDSAFLERLQIIDYSLLIGIRVRKGVSTLAAALGGLSASPNSPTRSLLDDDDPDDGNFKAFDPLMAGAWTGENFDSGLTSIPLASSVADFSGAALLKEETYYVGLIDVLQTYNSKKKLENFAKGFLVNRHKISVVPPDEYAQRLCVLIERISE